MRRSPICFFLLSLTLFSLGQSGPKQEAPTQQKSSEAKPNPPVSFVNPQPPAATKKNQSDGQPPKSRLPVWTDPFWSNWALVIITGFAVWVAIGTLNDVKEQTQLTKISADAALLNAQAIINTERPWVIIFGTYSNKVGSCSFHAGNLGRTPAEIIAFYAEHRCVRHINELPTVPEYRKKQVPSVTLLVPGKTLEDQSIELLDSETFLDKVDSCQREPGEKFPTPPKLSVFYFKVVYRHPLSRVRPNIPDYEARMCFCYSTADPQAPHVCGPDEYNAYT